MTPLKTLSNRIINEVCGISRFSALDAVGVVVKAAGAQTPREYREIVKQAGGYIPARHGLQVDMNGDFASVHCLIPGRYDFRAPNGEVSPVNLRAGETLWIFFN